MGEWREVKRLLYKKDGNPCHGCQFGWCSLQQKEENGTIYEKRSYCQEVCGQYQDYIITGLAVIPTKEFS